MFRKRESLDATCRCLGRIGRTYKSCRMFDELPKNINFYYGFTRPSQNELKSTFFSLFLYRYMNRIDSYSKAVRIFFFLLFLTTWRCLFISLIIETSIIFLLSFSTSSSLFAVCMSIYSIKWKLDSMKGGKMSFL